METKLLKKLILWFISPLWGFMIAMAWNLEEPNKISTILVVWLVQFLALLIINKANNAKILHSDVTWIIAFNLKLLVTLVIVQYLWVPSNAVLGGHRQPGDVFDPVKYDYFGADWAKSSYMTTSVMYGGVIYYIGAIYKIFGVSVFYVALFNCLLTLCTFLFITGILTLASHEKKPWKYMVLGLFLPLIAYLDAIPSKSPLVLFSMSMALFSMNMVNRKTKYLLYYSALVFSLVALLAVRATMVLVIAFIALGYLLWDFKKNRSQIIAVSLMVVALFVISSVVISMSGGYAGNIVANAFDISQKVEWGMQLQYAGENSISALIMPHNFLEAILYAPIRSVFFMVAPFPNIFLDFTISPLRNIERTSVWLIILLMPAIFSAVLHKRCRITELYPQVIIPFVLLIILLANGQFIIHPRYRVMLDPIFLATALIGFRYGTPRVFVSWTFLIVLMGFGGYFILKSIA